MTIGPEPMTRTEARSARRGMLPPGTPGHLGPLHQRAELVEQVVRVVRARRGLGMVLDSERWRVEQPDALDHAVVEVQVRYDRVPVGRVERHQPRAYDMRLLLAGRRGGELHGETVVVAGDVHPAGVQ